MFCKMRLSEQIHTVYCVYHWWYTGTISKSKSLHWYRCKVQHSGAVGAWFVQCTPENRQKSFGHPILAEQVATERCGMYLRGGASRQSQWWPQAAGAGGSVSISTVELWSFEWRLPRTEEKCGGRLLMEGQRIFFCFCISGFCKILKDINVGI